MADDTVDDSCLDVKFGSASDNCLHNKRKYRGYYYVPSESDEADTLKDKFWRDLEQGKLNFLNTVDMYTRVKRPGKLPQADCCLAISNHHPLFLSDSAQLTRLQSSALGHVIPATDVSPPSSSGYESCSASSSGSSSVTDSPTEPHHCVAGSCGLFIAVGPKSSLLQRKKKTSNKCIWQSSYKSKRRKCHTVPPRKVSNRNKTIASRFFRYVDASSEEADTLKDKFWRDLEMGNVGASTTIDLYSSVKVSRRTRQLSLFSVTNSDEAKDSAEVHVPVTSNCTEMSDVGVEGCEAGTSSCNKTSESDQQIDCCLSEQTANVLDCKLVSPCSVSVERLALTADDVGLLGADTAINLPSDMSVNVSCKRCLHGGRCKTGLKHRDADSFLHDSYTTSLAINRSLPLCDVLLRFPSTWQRHIVCGWLEDEAIAKTGEVLLHYT